MSKQLFSRPQLPLPLTNSEVEHPVIGWLIRRGLTVHRARLLAFVAFNLGRAA